ncbi:phosphotransferase family protein [Embleya sp. NPDC055664]|uniref:phosphotransferase family protein n=1 Tax=Embleya sp. NPDC059237 TaxID=3346784 RepID=UPI0036CC9D9C
MADSPPPPPNFHTAPRTPWDALPTDARAAVERCAGRVLGVATVWAGFNCEFAATVTTERSRFFVKGVPRNHPAALQQRVEVRVAPHVHTVAPRLRWEVRLDDWVLLGFDHITGRHADFAPGTADLPLVADALRRLGRVAVRNLPLPRIEERWRSLLTHRQLELLRGESLLHTDLHPHNVLIGDRGPRAYLVDWAQPARGPAWIEVTMVAGRLMDEGHTAEQAASWADRFACWRTVSREAMETFVFAATNQCSRGIGAADAAPWNARLTALAEARAARTHRRACPARPVGSRRRSTLD